MSQQALYHETRLRVLLGVPPPLHALARHQNFREKTNPRGERNRFAALHETRPMTEQAPLTPQFVQQLITVDVINTYVHAQTTLLACVKREVTQATVLREMKLKKSPNSAFFVLDIAAVHLTLNEVRELVQGPIVDYLNTVADKHHYDWSVTRDSPDGLLTLTLHKRANNTVVNKCRSYLPRACVYFSKLL